MIEQLKKALTTGVGLALKTWTEVEDCGKEMIKKAQLSENDAGQFLKSLKESYEKTQKKMEVTVNRLVKDVLKKADIATNDDVKISQARDPEPQEGAQGGQGRRESRPAKRRRQGQAAPRPRPKPPPERPGLRLRATC